MTGLRIDFEAGGASINLNSLVRGDLAQVQNMLVNIATESPAPVFEDRGTTLLTTFARTGFISRVYAQHQANFAALNTLYFCKSFNSESQAFTGLTMTAPPTGSDTLTFTLAAAFNGGTITNTALTL